MNGEEERLAARDCLNKEGKVKKTENAWIKRRRRERKERERKPCQQGERRGRVLEREVIRGIKANTAPLGRGGGQWQAVSGAGVSQTLLLLI